jgi:hypothetical protein
MKAAAGAGVAEARCGWPSGEEGKAFGKLRECWARDERYSSAIAGKTPLLARPRTVLRSTSQANSAKGMSLLTWTFMHAGTPFPRVLEERLAECKVLLALIGPGWLNAQDDQGRRRLDDLKDWVRLEIAKALKRNITVIPIRVEGTELPKKVDLPEDIRDLVDRQAAVVSTKGFRNEMAGLARDIRAIPNRTPPQRQVRPSVYWQSRTLAAICAVIAVWLAWFFWPRDAFYQTMPGFTAYAVVRIFDTPELRRKYLFDFETPEGAKASFYISAADRFTWAITDVHKEPYQLEIPQGRGKVPLDEVIALFCQVGLTDTATLMRVVINGGEIGRRALPFPINLGKMEWTKLTLGSNMPFRFFEEGVYSKTLTDREIGKLTQNARQFGLLQK